MSRTTDAFISSHQPVETVLEAIAQAFGAPFHHPDDGAPYLVNGETDVYVHDTHRFDDDDVRRADGTWVPLASDYPHWIEIRNVASDQAQQRQVGEQVFEALKSFGYGKVVLIDNFQHVVDSYDPDTEDVSAR